MNMKQFWTVFTAVLLAIAVAAGVGYGIWAHQQGQQGMTVEERQQLEEDLRYLTGDDTTSPSLPDSVRVAQWRADQICMAVSDQDSASRLTIPVEVSPYLENTGRGATGMEVFPQKDADDAEVRRTVSIECPENEARLDEK